MRACLGPLKLAACHHLTFLTTTRRPWKVNRGDAMNYRQFGHRINIKRTMLFTLIFLVDRFPVRYFQSVMVQGDNAQQDMRWTGIPSTQLNHLSWNCGLRT